MVYETVLTILFAVGIGAAIIVYAARPRQRGASISVASVAPASAIESFAPAGAADAVQMPQVTAVETPVVESSNSAESSAISDVAPAVAVSAAGFSQVPLVAPSTADLSAVAPVASDETDGSQAQASPKVHRTQRRKSTTTKTHARSSAKTDKEALGKAKVWERR